MADDPLARLSRGAQQLGIELTPEVQSKLATLLELLLASNAQPGIDLWLLEATAKKARFIESAATSLRLRGAGVLTGRAETLAHHPQLRESFDLTLARAVAPLPTLVELALPFLRLGGHLAAMKGSRAGQEIADAAKALELCGGMVAKELPVVEGASLGLILVRKSSPTPDRFPRRPGQPASHPLGT